MVKYNKKWCLKNCPYINGNKNFRWKYYNSINGTHFFIMIKKNKFPVCVEIENGYVFKSESNFLLRMLNEHVDMEKHAKKCPVYAEMMMENFNDNDKV